MINKHQLEHLIHIINNNGFCYLSLYVNCSNCLIKEECNVNFITDFSPSSDYLISIDNTVSIVDTSNKVNINFNDRHVAAKKVLATKLTKEKLIEVLL